MVLDNLAVSITSQVADVKAGISSVRTSFVNLAGTAQGTAGRLDEASDEMDELTRSSLPLITSTQILQGRLDEAGDEARNLGFSAIFANTGLQQMSFGAQLSSLSVMGLSSSVTIALIPALLTLSTILAPLVATLGVLGAVAVGVGGGFAAVIGTGIIAGFEQLKEVAMDTLDVFEVLLTNVGEEFVPVLLDGLFALPGVLADVINAAGDLTPFANALGELGGIAASALPDLVGRLAELGREALPSVIGFVETLVEDGPTAFNMLQESADRAIPVLRNIGGAFIDIAPELLEFGTNVLELVGPALVDLIEIGGQVMRFVNELTPNLRNLTLGLAILAPVVVGLVSLLGGPFTAAFIGVLALVAAWEDDFLGVRTTITGVVDTLMGKFGEFQSFFSQLVSNLSDEFGGWIRGAVDMINGLIRGLNDFIRAANDTGLVDIGTVDPVQTPFAAQTATSQFSEQRQAQRQTIDVRIQSDDEKFEAEVRELSGGEFTRLQNAQADRADRINPS